MAEPFDPYLKWLGIPPKHQPPNDYRLLGVESFEADPDAIANAADQRMAHLKTFSAGEHSALSQRILNEIAAARVRLLNPQKKAQYDARLRKATPKPAPAARPKPKASQAAANTAAARPIPVSASKPASPIAIDTGETSMAARTSGATAAEGGLPPWVIPGAIIGGGSLLVLVVALAVIGGGDDDTQQANRGTQEKTTPTGAQSGPGPDGPRVELPVRVTPTRVTSKTNISPTPPVPTPPSPTPPDPVVPTPGPSNPGPSNPTPPTPVHPTPPISPGPGTVVGPGGNPTTPATPIAPQKLPEPDATAQQKARSLIREIYEEEFSAADTPQAKMTLAAQLHRDATGTKGDPSSRYMLLRMGAEEAASAEGFDLAMKIIDQIDAEYEVNTPSLKADALEAIAKSAVVRPEAVLAAQQVVLAAERLRGEALARGDVITAGRLVTIAMPSARKLKDRELVASLQATGQQLDQLAARYTRVKAAETTLKTTPKDPQANLLVGTWYCFVVGDWDKGLPCLAAGGDATLASLAASDLANPREADAQVLLGDRWWELAEAKTGEESTRVKARASHWYRQALPGLSGLQRTKLAKRLSEIGVDTGAHALKFDGRSSYVLVPKFAYRGETPITIEAIVRVDSAQSPQPGVYTPGIREQVIFGNTPIAEGGLMLGRYSSSWAFKVAYAYQYSTTSSIYSRYQRVTSRRSITTDKWTHLAGVYDGRQASLYVDGELQSTLAVQGVFVPGLFPFLIGASPTGNTTSGAPTIQSFFGGMVRAIRVSNSARYTENFDPPESLDGQSQSTVLYFSFSEGRGNRLTDAAAKKIVGEIRGATWVKVEPDAPAASTVPGSSTIRPPSTPVRPPSTPLVPPTPSPPTSDPSFTPHLPARPPRTQPAP